MLNKIQKENIIKKSQLRENDTGSAQVQIAVLNEKIEELNEHLKIHRKDKHSRLGLLKMVSQRKKLQKYVHQL